MNILQYASGMGRTYLDEHIPVTILIKAIRVKNLKLWDIPTTVHVLSNEIFVWVTLLRILVEELHVRMRRGRVQIVVELLDIFTVVPLVASHAEEAFLEDGVLTVPQR